MLIWSDMMKVLSERCMIKMNYELFRKTREIVLECADIAEKEGLTREAALLRNCAIKTSNRMTRAAGYARFKKSTHGHEIIMSNVFFGNGKNKNELRETVTHEAAHIVAGLHNGHNTIWKATHRMFGGNGLRCHSMPVKIKKRPTKTVKCNACNETIEIGPTRYKRIVSGKKNYYHIPCGRSGRLTIV